MKLNEFFVNKNRRKARKRVGRGPGSGNGTTAGRGNNGYNSRSGGGVRKGFEGGQMPIHRRLPKRGFTNIFKKKYQIVNLVDLEKHNFSGIVNKDVLFKFGIINSPKKRVKLLGNGGVKIALNIFVEKASKSAISKVVDAGGKIEGVI